MSIAYNIGIPLVYQTARQHLRFFENCLYDAIEICLSSIFYYQYAKNYSYGMQHLQ